MTGHAGADDELRRLNVEIGKLEADRDAEALDRLLHDDLVFRRADGALVRKREYLDAVPTRTYDRMETEVQEIDRADASSVVTVIVDTAGTGPRGPFAGRFRNTRVFVQDGGRWRCRIWVNVRLEPDT